MKKILMLFVCLMLFTGCEANLKYNFNDYIESNVSANFNLSEYSTFTNNNYGNDFGYQSAEVLKQSIEDTRYKINAFINNNSTFYNPIEYSTNNDIYNANYKYVYTYSNFKDNYFLNQCFDNFIMQEDDSAYYIKMSGDSICNGVNLVINADDRMINNNANSVRNNEYIWNIKSNNNDIYFAISKTPMNSSSISMLYVAYFVIGIAIAFVAYVLKNKMK